MIEPVTIEEARRQVRLDDDGEDALLADLIAAAREWVEAYTGLILTRREVIETRDGFTGCLDLYAWPVESVDTVTYRDAGWTDQPLTADRYVVMKAARPARLVAPGGWPRTAGRDAVTVTMTAGFEPGAVPKLLKSAVLIVLAGLHESRTEQPEATAAAARALCGSFKRWRV